MKKSTTQVAIIGFFVLGAIVFLAVLLMTMGGNKWARSTLRYRTLFPTSVKGLRVGSPVMFRGVAIGEVESISLAPQERTASFDSETDLPQDVLPVLVKMKIFPERLGYESKALFQFLPHNTDHVRQADAFLGRLVQEHHLRAQLGTLSLLTGQIYISLNFINNPTDESNALAQKQWQEGIIPSYLTLASRLTGRVNEGELVNQIASLQRLMGQLSRFIDAGGSQKLLDEFAGVSANVERISTTLGERLPALLERMQSVSERLDTTLARVDGVLGNVQGDLEGTIAGTRGLVGNLNTLLTENDGSLKVLPGQLGETLDAVRKASEEAHELLAIVRAGAAPGSPERIRLEDALRECDLLMVQIRTLLESLNRNPQSLILGK